MKRWLQKSHFKLFAILGARWLNLQVVIGRRWGRKWEYVWESNMQYVSELPIERVMYAQLSSKSMFMGEWWITLSLCTTAQIYSIFTLNPLRTWHYNIVPILLPLLSSHHSLNFLLVQQVFQNWCILYPSTRISVQHHSNIIWLLRDRCNSCKKGTLVYSKVKKRKKRNINYMQWVGNSK